MKKLDATKICAVAQIPRERLVLLDTVDSTNLLAKKLAAQGAAHGTAVLSETQSAGRGRMGRSFLSPEGGIYLSVILRPEGTAEDLLPLTALLAAVACDAVEEVCAFRPQIKWLNDLVAGDKKLAGILTELVLDGTGNVTAAVCGIGINCLAAEDAFSPEVRAMATSLSAVTGAETDRDALAGLLIDKISRVLRSEQKTALMAQYRRDCMTLGKTVRVVRGDESYIATAQHVDDDGALWVLTETGERKKVLSGEVSVRGLYGYATPLHNGENVV